MTNAAALVARLAESGIDPVLLADVAQELFTAEVERNALAERRKHDRERKARSRDVTGQPVTTEDVTGEPPSPLSPPKKDPKPQKITPPISPNPDYLRGKDLPEGLPAEPWMAFVRSRKAIPKVPFTEDAARGAARKTLKLASEGYDAAKLLWMAVDKGWRTVFPNEDCRAIAVKSDKPWTVEELRNGIRFRRDIGDEAKAQELEAELQRRLAA